MFTYAGRRRSRHWLHNVLLFPSVSLASTVTMTMLPLRRAISTVLVVLVTDRDPVRSAPPTVHPTAHPTVHPCCTGGLAVRIPRIWIIPTNANATTTEFALDAKIVARVPKTARPTPLPVVTECVFPGKAASPVLRTAVVAPPVLVANRHRIIVRDRAARPAAIRARSHCVKAAVVLRYVRCRFVVTLLPSRCWCFIWCTNWNSKTMWCDVIRCGVIEWMIRHFTINEMNK